MVVMVGVIVVMAVVHADNMMIKTLSSPLQSDKPYLPMHYYE